MMNYAMRQFVAEQIPCSTWNIAPWLLHSRRNHRCSCTSPVPQRRPERSLSPASLAPDPSRNYSKPKTLQKFLKKEGKKILCLSDYLLQTPIHSLLMQNHRRHNGTGATTGTTELTTQQRQQMNTVPTPPATSKTLVLLGQLLQTSSVSEGEKDVPAHRKKAQQQSYSSAGLQQHRFKPENRSKKNGKLRTLAPPSSLSSSSSSYSSRGQPQLLFFFWAAALEWYNESVCEGKFVHL